jgi:fatty-acid desaturase
MKDLDEDAGTDASALLALSHCQPLNDAAHSFRCIHSACAPCSVVSFQKRYLQLGYFIFGLIVPGLIGQWIEGEGGFVVGAVWIGFVGRLLSWHAIWTINSISHWESDTHWHSGSSSSSSSNRSGSDDQ